MYFDGGVDDFEGEGSDCCYKDNEWDWFDDVDDDVEDGVNDFVG